MGNHTATQAKGQGKGQAASARPAAKPKSARPSSTGRENQRDSLKAAREAERQATLTAWQAGIAAQRDPANFAGARSTTPAARLAGITSAAQRQALFEDARTLAAATATGWDHERAIVRDAQGRSVVGIITGKPPNVDRGGHAYEEVSVTKEQAAAIRASDRPAYLHTHPYGSFSREDVATFIYNGLVGMHAVGPGPDGRTWLFSLTPGRNPGTKTGRLTSTSDRKHGLMARMRAIEDRIDAQHVRALRAGRMSAVQDEATFAHDVMRQFAREVGPDLVRYEAGPLV